MARNVELDYPNREKPASKAMRLVVVLMLLVSCGFIAATTIKGWDLMEDAKPLNIVFIALNLIFVVQVLRWSRGVLPMAAGIGAFIAIFAGVSINSWYERDAIGYKDASLSADLGFLTIIILVVQLLVIIVTIVAFSQNWQEEIERVVPDTRGPDTRGPETRQQGTVPA